jgi:hypothetical protein
VSIGKESRVRYRVIPERCADGVQYLVFDTFEDEIVGAHREMHDALAQRDGLEANAEGG